jgi:hypothetical protein
MQRACPYAVRARGIRVRHGRSESRQLQERTRANIEDNFAGGAASERRSMRVAGAAAIAPPAFCSAESIRPWRRRPRDVLKRAASKAWALSLHEPSGGGRRSRAQTVDGESRTTRGAHAKRALR